MPAMALCDRDGVYGAPRFFARAREIGVRPIVGAELTMEDQTILPVLVESRHGYQNLCQLLTRAHLRNEKGKAAVLWDELPEFTEGLVALTGDEEGPLGEIPNSKFQTLNKLQELIQIFGRQNLFIEIQRHRLRREQGRVHALIALAEQFRLPL